MPILGILCFVCRFYVGVAGISINIKFMTMVYALERSRCEHVTQVVGVNDANTKLTPVHIQAAPHKIRKTK
jgi:hypothetical protein